MSEQTNTGRTISRRGVLGGLGAAWLGSQTADGTLAAEDAATPPPAKSGLSTVRKGMLETDVVIAGGGMAGTCAALAAARTGVRVVLIQDRPVLGGNASSEIRMHIVGADGGPESARTDTRETGIIEELRLIDAVQNPQRSPSMWDLLLYDMVRREPNILLLLNTHVVGAKMAGPDRIAAVIAHRPGTEDAFEISGRMFIDCSGDGRLGFEAGAEFRVGREGREEFGESLAPPQPDATTLGSSILFMSRRHDRPMPFVAPPWAHRFESCEDLPWRPHGTWEYGFWWNEWGGHLDTIRDNERIRDELLATALGLWDHIKNSGAHPDSAHWALEWLGFVPGKRESRRFVGDYILRQQDVQGGEVFEDGVAYGGWPIDLHPAEGIHSREKPAIQIHVPLYNIPFRCLYSRNIANLLFAGRNISASHVAFGSTRVMATCSVMGQAAGTAAALCVRNDCSPRQLGRESITALQQRLLRDDAYIVGVRNRDPDDHALTAAVTATSGTPEGPAEEVISGIHRRVYDRSNCWISDPRAPLPQSITLRFKAPLKVREVHVTFDTGLRRRLTLTHSDHFNAGIVRGPQPETVRDYDLSLLSGGQAREVVEVRGNYLRKRVHRIEPSEAEGLTLTVRATHGDPSARVFEIRVYS